VACRTVRMLHTTARRAAQPAPALDMIIDAAHQDVGSYSVEDCQIRTGGEDQRLREQPDDSGAPAIWLARKCKSTILSSDDLKAISDRERRFGSGCSLGNSGLNLPMR
jgi:hypothetical protein